MIQIIMASRMMIRDSSPIGILSDDMQTYMISDEEDMQTVNKDEEQEASGDEGDL